MDFMGNGINVQYTGQSFNVRKNIFPLRCLGGGSNSYFSLKTYANAHYQVPVGKKLVIVGFNLLGSITAATMAVLQVGHGSAAPVGTASPAGDTVSFTQYIQLGAVASAVYQKSDCFCEIAAGRYPYMKTDVASSSWGVTFYCYLEDV